METKESINKLEDDLNAMHNSESALVQFQIVLSKPVDGIFCNMNGQSFERIIVVGDVGLVLDGTLNWNEHVRQRVGKAVKALLSRSNS